MRNSTKLYCSLLYRIAAFAVAIGFILRIILLFNAQTIDRAYSAGQWIEIFGVGILNDLLVSILSFAFMWLYIAVSSEAKYSRPWGYVCFGILAAVTLYEAVSDSTLLDQYGGVVPEIGLAVLCLWTLSFGIKLFFPKLRKSMRLWCFYLLAFAYCFGILLNAVSEYYFWNEFGVRYNFIAVDYLIYTNEVIGNIFESYPIIPLLAVIIAASAAMTVFLVRGLKKSMTEEQPLRVRLSAALLYAVAAVAAIAFLTALTSLQTGENAYVNELQANGACKFYQAFMSNELSYKDFYETLDKEPMERIVRSEFSSSKRNLHKAQSIDTVSGSSPNIILITIESLSASFMEHYGSTSGITPQFDSLYDLGLRFNNLYAVGNRTVRGLEAVTLCLPPCAGQSIIKRKNNSNLFSTASVLREHGYRTIFFYGGDSYFDNMESFFSGNGYDIVDKKSFSSDEITFGNVWGVCDQDSFRKVIKVLGSDSVRNNPFFAHIMTVSNHRPFTYPDGMIDIPTDSKSRKGGVKYSDFALGEFMRSAAKEPWFSNTIFLITADHCASSAGKTEIPLDKYRIPALIYSPGRIQPQDMNTLCSQIDLMPTVLSMAGIEYESKFYGRSIFDENFVPRAYVATYQDLGFLYDNTLTVLSPVRRHEQYTVKPASGNKFELIPMQTDDVPKKEQAIADYQSSAEWYVD